MRASTSRVAVVSTALFAGVASALSISSQCQSTLLTIAGSPEAACLNPGGLLPIITAGNSSSLVQPISSWLQGTCAQDQCSNQTLSDIVANVTSGCSSDLSSLGFNGDEQTVAQIVQEAYPTVREVACLKVSSNNTLCVENILNELQSTFGTLSINNVMTQLPQLVQGEASDIPQYIQCSDCVKQAYNLINGASNGAVGQQSNVTSALTQQCGADFVNGQAPSAIAEGTGSAAPTGASSAALGFGMSGQTLAGAAASSLVAVFSAFFVLA